MINKKSISLAKTAVIGMVLLTPFLSLQAGSPDGYVSPTEITMDVIPSGKPDTILREEGERASFARDDRPERPEVAEVSRPEIERPEVQRPEVERPEVEVPEVPEISRERERPRCKRRS